MDSKEEITEIIIHLSPEQAAFLDALAAEEGTSRSAIAQAYLTTSWNFLWLISSNSQALANLLNLLKVKIEQTLKGDDQREGVGKAG